MTGVRVSDVKIRELLLLSITVTIQVLAHGVPPPTTAFERFPPPTPISHSRGFPPTPPNTVLVTTGPSDAIEQRQTCTGN